MATRLTDEWKEVVSITYKVVEEQLGRDKPMDTTLARTLQVAGEYKVNEKNFDLKERKDGQTFEF